MGVELVHVAALLAADVALPGVGVAVAAFVEEVQGGVGERYGAEGTYERGRQQRSFAVRRGDHAAFGRRRAGRLQQFTSPVSHLLLRYSKSIKKYNTTLHTFVESLNSVKRTVIIQPKLNPN